MLFTCCASGSTTVCTYTHTHTHTHARAHTHTHRPQTTHLHTHSRAHAQLHTRSHAHLASNTCTPHHSLHHLNWQTSQTGQLTRTPSVKKTTGEFLDRRIAPSCPKANSNVAGVRCGLSEGCGVTKLLTKFLFVRERVRRCVGERRGCVVMIVECRERGSRHKATRVGLTIWLKLVISESRDAEENDARGNAPSAPACVDELRALSRATSYANLGDKSCAKPTLVCRENGLHLYAAAALWAWAASAWLCAATQFTNLLSTTFEHRSPFNRSRSAGVYSVSLRCAGSLQLHSLSAHTEMVHGRARAPPRQT